jgi:hypothetical protein
VPWGLVFDGDLDSLPTEASPAEVASAAAYGGFWNIKYTLATVLSGCAQPAAKLARPRENFRLLSIIDRHIYASISRDLVDGAREFDELVRQPVGVAFNLDACERLIEEAAAKDTILYFLGHGTRGEILHLGEEEEIDSIRLKMWIDRLTKRGGRSTNSCSLLVLNACESAISADDYSLRSAAARPGICGYIAAEARVPRDFAFSFGHMLLRNLSLGHSVGESMDAIRHDATMWPMSLLYGCYAYPDYRIQST